jgi:transposase
MPVQVGQDRGQIQFYSLDSLIEADNEVRAIEALVDKVPLEGLGFKVKGKSREGRPAFSARMLLKLYVYGYRNRVRSSRQLERACGRNVELWWLLNYQRPCYKVIADFRKDNASALRKAFRYFNKLYLEWGLFGGELAAIDGTKIRAQNSRKNNYNEAKIERHLDYIDNELETYFEEADLLDGQESEEAQQRIEEVSNAVDGLMLRRHGYEQLAAELEASGERQISSTDPDARALPMRMGIVEVGYNVQSAVDSKHCLVAHYEAANEKDDMLLSQMAAETKEALGAESLEVLADKGYHAGVELKACEEAGITAYVSPKEAVNPKKEEAYQKSKFEYDSELDIYTCPEGKELKSNGKWYEKNKGKHRRSYRFKRYQSPFSVCSACPVRDKCLGAKQAEYRHGRAIERSEYEGYIEANAERVKGAREKYRRRQAMVEHPFGTIKRHWGYGHTLLKGKKKVNGEFALIFSCYNFSRIVSILGVKGLISKARGLFWSFLARWCTVAGLVRAEMGRCCGAWRGSRVALAGVGRYL